MADFKLPKGIDEIVEGKLLDEGMYVVRITDEPQVVDNKKKQAGMSAEEGAGENLVVKLRIQSDKPDENGRAFTCYLPWPNEADALRPPNPFSGQPRLDEKIQKLVMWHAAFNGGTMPKGTKIKLEAGSEARIFVKKGVDNRDQDNPVERNEIDFNAIPEPL